MSEPLALLGAEVTGIDPAQKMVSTARDHLKTHENLNVTYVCDTIESYCLNHRGQFDAVTFFDVAEHVADVGSVLKASVECLKPGGQIFITTWNKTFMGWLYGIVMLEYVTGLVPRGAHSISMFVNPETIEALLLDYGCEDIETRGTWFSLWTREWSFTDYKGVFYAMKAVKE
jgi:polyprenyldihydroxybenzoate methyltransferase/3-demethylubiquinol 3-O-methyltransferase